MIPERDVLSAVLSAAKVHPRVAWAERMNSGVWKAGGRYIKFGFPGLSDVIGQLKDGRFLAIEVKREGKNATEEQVEFLGTVTRAKGIGFVARNVDDCIAGINAAFMKGAT